MKYLIIIILIVCGVQAHSQEISIIDLDYISAFGEKRGYSIDLPNETITIKSIVQGHDRIKSLRKKRLNEITVAISVLRPSNYLYQEIPGGIDGAWITLKIVGTDDVTKVRYWYDDAPEEIRNLYLLVNKHY